MSTAWYIIPYKRREQLPGMFPARYCAMDDHTSVIQLYDGAWAESEILGNVAVVKVRSRDAVLNFLDEQPGFVRLPRNRLDNTLDGLSTSVISHLRDILLTAGYTIDEIRDEFGDGLENHTLRDYLHFWAQRRLKPRYNPVNDTIYIDGEAQQCRTIESVDEEVSDEN